MKKIFDFIFCLLVLFGCTSEFEESSSDKCTHICTMQMEASLMDFDDENPSEIKTRSGKSSLFWTDGDRIYLFFEVDNAIVPGIATYSSAEDQWTLEYTGTLSVVEDANVQTYYIKNASKYSGTEASLNAQSCLYVDSFGNYSCLSDRDVRIISNLTPNTGRIKFKGTPGQTIKLSEIDTYTSFDLKNGKIGMTDDDISLSVHDDGFTPYIYGSINNEERIIRMASDYCLFEKKCNYNVLAKGKSGWISIPTINDNKGWQISPTIPTVLSENAVVNGSNVTIYGKILGNGGSPIIDYGFYFGDSPNTMNKIVVGTEHVSNFNKRLTGLQKYTNYFYRTYAANSMGNAFGEICEFTTQAIEPKVRTGKLTENEHWEYNGSSYDISYSIIFRGEILDSGGANITEYGFVYGPTRNNLCYKKVVGTSNKTGEFDYSFTSNDIYFVRAYAKNSVGIAYGEIIAD